MNQNLIRCLLLTAIMFSGLSIAGGLTAQEILEIQNKTWRINLEADVPGLFPKAIQFAIFEKDPYPYFIEELKKRKGKMKKNMEKEIDYNSKEEVFEIYMSKCWDAMFRQVTGEDVYILSTTNRLNYSISVSDSSPGGRKWVVSKISFLDDRPVCWYFPLDVTTGKESDLKFFTTNTFDIKTKFRKLYEEN